MCSVIDPPMISPAGLRFVAWVMVFRLIPVDMKMGSVVLALSISHCSLTESLEVNES